jgi:tripartite-type tricarboxylate transporter receptor subunit TctC
MMILRRALVIGLITTGMALPAMAQNAAPWPNRQIKLLVPLAPGSAVDTVARLVTEKMSEDLGQPIVVENMPGAAGLLGMRTGARAEPDGYTIMAVNDSITTMLPNLKADVGYDSLNDFAPITQMAAINFGFVAHPSFGPKNIRELIALAKEKPGSVDFASGGLGSPQHVAMELFMWKTGTRMNHLPYRGVTFAFNDVLSGHVPTMIVGFPAPNQHMPAGKIKLLAVTSAQRSKVFPDVPTVAEQGVEGFDFSTWAGLIAPARTPQPIIERLNASAVKALRDPALNKKLIELGYDVLGNQPEDFRNAIRSGLQKYAELTKAVGMKLD